MPKERFYCNVCKNENWHDIVANHEQEYYDNLWGFTRLIKGQILKCTGM